MNGIPFVNLIPALIVAFIGAVGYLFLALQMFKDGCFHNKWEFLIFVTFVAVIPYLLFLLLKEMYKFLRKTSWLDRWRATPWRTNI